jgi:hypothetical protein
MTALTLYKRFGPSPGAGFADSADLRLAVGCERLAVLVLDAISSLPDAAKLPRDGGIQLLTLITYAYTANILSSADLELATIKQPDLAYLARGIIVTADGIRQFRRQNSVLIKICLGRVRALGEFRQPPDFASQTRSFGRPIR